MTPELEAKLTRLLAHHRKYVFDPVFGDHHERAIHRLKATPTARAIFAQHAANERARVAAIMLTRWA